MTKGNEFDTASSSFFSAKDYVGELVLFSPTQYIEEMKTSFSTAEKPYCDAIMTDVVVITANGEEFEDALIFQSALIGSLKRKIGRKLLGRLGRGEAKKGQSAPYLLEAPSDDDIKLATEFLAGRMVKDATPSKTDDPWAS